MDAKNFRLIGMYLINRVDYRVFKEMLTRLIGFEPDKGYLDEKWEYFSRNQLLFALNNIGFIQIAIERIKAENYRG